MYRLVQTVPVWGVNRKDEIFRWTGSSLRLSQMGLSNRFRWELKNIWGVNAKNQILLGPVMVGDR